MTALNSRRAKAAALVGAGITAGVIGAWTLSSNAQGSSTPSSSGSTPGTSGTSTSTSAPSVPTGPMDHDGDHRGGPGGRPGGPGAQNPDETLVTGTKESTLKAAALKQVPGGTVDRVETDSGDAAYEVHMSNAGGKQVTVKFDKNLRFVAVEDGMGK
jgi:hypothetical protein